MAAVIKTQGLGKDFGPTKALQDVSFEVHEHVTTGLVGPNGAGKTTLFSLLCGFLQPTAGEITVLGHPPSHPALRNRVSILPQDARFLKSLPVGLQLANLAELQGFSRAESRVESDRVLGLVDLKSSRGKMPDNLSHGMLKRIAIAQAFIGSPEVVLLDEPTSGLDPNTASGIKALIRDLRQQRTFIISSHNLEVIEDLCQEILILNKGRLTSQESIADLTARSEVLTFRLDKDPDGDVAEVFAGLQMVTKVVTAGVGEHRIVIHYQAEPGAHAEIEILKCMADAGLSYREMIRGERLEESVRGRLS